MTDPWDPEQYARFKAERRLPFWDLLERVRPRYGMRAIDLGCGTGELTAVLAERLDADVDGIDTSPAMLAKAAPLAHSRLRFRDQDIAALTDLSPFDLVFSNAALHWVPDHEGLLRRLLPTMRPGAQLVFQLPRNMAHPSHTLAAELGAPARNHSLAAERYAELLFEHGFGEIRCVEKLYLHILPSTADVVEWTRGTLLNRADDDLLAEYRRRLLATLGDHRPYLYTYRRLLLSAQAM